MSIRRFGGHSPEDAMKRGRPAAGQISHHPNSIYYKNPPDFALLAQQYLDFAKHVQVTKSGSSILDWNDPDALLSLTKVLLRHDFNIDFDMPRHHLCPPVPQRLNYMLWVEKDLLNLLPKSTDVIGIDIGTGASAILALLGSSLSMNFVCTEIDPESVQSARKNIASNLLQDRIEVIHVQDRSKLLAGVVSEDQRFDFCVCNPPFFDSLEETGQNSKRMCLATNSELICNGGEFNFVEQLVRESAAIFKHRIGWYTTMLGKKTTLSKLLPVVRATNPICVQTTVFKQGRQTRWGLAWSYRNDIALEKLAQKLAPHNQSSLKQVFVVEQKSIEKIKLVVNEWVQLKSGEFVNKSPVSALLSVPVGDYSARFKMSFVPMNSSQVRIVVDIECSQSDQCLQYFEQTRAELESILI